MRTVDTLLQKDPRDETVIGEPLYNTDPRPKDWDFGTDPISDYPFLFSV